MKYPIPFNIIITLFNVIIGLFCTITAMEKTTKKNYLWIKTQDNKIVTIDKPIAQQSNLITVLQQQYKGTNKHPIPITTNQEEFNFFCSSITQNPLILFKEFSDEQYSNLMKITAQLKALLFYTELMLPLIPLQELQNRFSYEHFNPAKFKKIIYKKYLKKTCIQNNHQPGTKILSINFDNTGNYFTETAKLSQNRYITYLWNTKALSIIKNFAGCQSPTFIPHKNCIITNDGIYFIKKDLYYIKSFNNNDKPIISPQGDFFIHCLNPNHLYTLFNTDTLNETKLSQTSDYPITILFHPDKNTVFYSKDIKNKNYLMIYNLITSTHHNTNIITKNSLLLPSTNTCAINTHGSLLLLNHCRLYNIKNPYKPKIIKENICNRASDYEPWFIPHKDIIFYQLTPSFFCLLDCCGNIITLYQPSTSLPRSIINITTDSTGNYLAFINNKAHKPSTIELWNLSTLPSKIGILRIHPGLCIHKIEFTKDQLLLTQSTTTQLWDMNGDNILNLGPSNTNAINPHTGSIITSQNLSLPIPSTTFLNDTIIPGRIKTYYCDINAQEAQETMTTIIKALTLPEVLLLNKYYAHKKTKKSYKLYPNLPDGRMLQTLIKKYGNLLEKFSLHARNYTSEKKQF